MMRTRTCWIPAASLSDASNVARAVHRGAAPRMPWHDSEEACQRRADDCNAIFGARPIKPFAILVEERTVDDGRIVNVWPVDKLGDIAATLAIVVGGCWLVAHATLI